LTTSLGTTAIRSPSASTLKAILAKLRPEPVRDPSLRPKVYGRRREQQPLEDFEVAEAKTTNR
jgi:hypothetical protein